MARVNLLLKVLKFQNKNQSSMFSLRGVPIFNHVGELKDYLLAHHDKEISPATDTSFVLGYYGARGIKLTRSSDDQLRESYLSEQLGYVTLWLDPHPAKAARETSRKRPAGESPTAMYVDFKKTKMSNTVVIEEESTQSTSYDSILSRLREKHGGKMADFKIKCWARMLVNGSYNNEAVPPNAAFFSGKDKATAPTSSISQPAETSHTEDKVKTRTLILQQLCEIQKLKDAKVLDDDEFASERKKIMKDLQSLD